MPDPSPRRAGKRGPIRESHRPDLMLRAFRVRTIIPPPEAGDVTMGLTDFGMLGNGPTPDNLPEYPDGAGCCGVAGFGHGEMLQALAAVVNGVPTYEAGFVVPTTPAIQNLYAQYGNAMGEGHYADQGVTNATFLKYLFDLGLIEWFGQLDITDPDEVHAAMLMGRGVLVAVALTKTAEPDFVNHLPWKLLDGPADHDVLLVAYAPNHFVVVTWGGLQVATGPIREAWAFGTKEDAERAGFTFEAIVAAIKAAGGSVTAPTSPATAKTLVGGPYFDAEPLYTTLAGAPSGGTMSKAETVLGMIASALTSAAGIVTEVQHVLPTAEGVALTTIGAVAAGVVVYWRKFRSAL